MLEGLSWLFPCGEECILLIKKKKKRKIWMLDTGTGFEYMIWISDYLFWSKDFENKDQILLWKEEKKEKLISWFTKQSMFL